MLPIHEFWETLFPMFKTNYEFMYLFFDVVSVLAMIRIFFSLPGYLLNTRRHI